MNKNNWKNKPNNNFNNQRPQYIKKAENFQGNQDFNFQNENQDDFGNQNYYYNQYQNNGNNKGQYHKRNNSNFTQNRNYNNNNKQNNNYRQYQNQNNNNFNNPNFAQNDFQNQNYRQKNQRFQNKQQQQYNDNSIPEWILDDEESTFQFGTFDKNQFKQELQQKQNSQKQQQASENQDDLNNEETFGNNNDDDDFDPFGQDFNSSNQNQQQSQKNSQNLENLELQQQQKQAQYNEQQKQLIKKLQDMVDPNTEILKQDFDANPSFKTNNNNNNKNSKQRKGSYNTNNNNQNKRKKSYNQMQQQLQQQQDFFMQQYMPEQLQNNLGIMLPPGFSQSQQQPQQNYPNLFQNIPYQQQAQLANNQQTNFQQQSNQQQQQQQFQQQQQQMQNQQIQNPFLQFSTEEKLPPQEEVWKYKTDSNDSEHGPFPSEAMNQWLYEGYFAQPNMMINYTKTNKWVKVDQFLNNIGIFKEDDSQNNNQESQLKNIEDKTAAEITWEEIQEAQKIGGEKLKLVEGILLGQKIVDKPEEKEGGFDTFEEMESHNTQLDKYYYQRDKLDEVFTSKELHYYNQINRQKEAIEMQNQQMKKMMQRMNKNHKKGGIQHNGYFQAPPGFDNINLQQMSQQQFNMMPQYINFQQQQVNAQTQNMMPQMGLQGNNNPNFYGYNQNIKFNNQQQQPQQQQQGFMPPGF